MAASVAAGLAAGWLLGGSWQRLQARSLHRLWLLVLAAGLQAAGTVLLAGPGYALTLVVSLGLAVAFLLANPQLSGRALLVGGLAANALVIALNGAMPVDLAAAARAGVPTGALLNDPRHVLAGRGTRLPALDDRWPLALPVLPQVLSAGDVLVAAGAGLLVCQGMRRRLRVGGPIRGG